MRKGERAVLCVLPATHAEHRSSPLKPEELQVLRSQYEKEGEYVGVQTKFNYAWVRSAPNTLRTTLAYSAIIGPHQVVPTQRTARRRTASLRDIPQRARTKT